MRLAIAIAAATLVAGFTVQDAEKALDGEWAGRARAIGLEIDAKGKTATLIEDGVKKSGAFKIESVSGAAATVGIGSARYLLHVRDKGATVLFAPIGRDYTDALIRVR